MRRLLRASVLSSGFVYFAYPYY